RTLEALGSTSGWRLHPRIEEALLRHPDCYIIVESLPDRFLWVGYDSEISIDLDTVTGRVYLTTGEGSRPVRPYDSRRGPWDLMTLQVYAPSLGDWFEQWLDEKRGVPPRPRELLPEYVETADLLDPEVVWRGVYRFGPDFELRQPDETDFDDP